MVINNNVENVKFLRNGSVFNPSGDKTARKVALDAMNGQLDNLADGTAILGRYQETNGVVMTLVGFAYISDNAKTLTVFDVEGASADVQALREQMEATFGSGVTTANTATAQLAALSGNTASTSAETSVEGAKRYAEDLISTLDSPDTAVTGSYVSEVSQADGKISVSRVALPDASSVADENKIVTDVTQSKGAITATASLLSGVKLSGYTVGGDDSGKIAETDTLGQALGKLQGQINGMDKAASAEDGKVVTTVTEVDGKVTETKANVKDLQLGGYQLDNSTGPIASADTINVALSKLENKVAANHISNDDASITVTEQPNDDTDIMVNIKSGEKVIRKDGSAGIWTDIAISAVTGTELTNLGTNVKEAYKLVDSYGGKLGEYVKIYKDSALVNFFLGHVDDKLTDADPTTQESPTSAVTSGTGDTALVYIMQLANGNYKLTAVDVEDFIEEAEFASGVTWDNEAHKVKGVVDLDSEKDESNVAFLTVGANGFKVSGIKDAIDTKINKLDADLSGNTTHVTVGVQELNGKITGVTVAENNIASQSLLDELSGKSVTQVAMTGGTVGIVASDNPADGTKKITINTDGSQIKMTNYTKGSDSGAVASSDSINAAISKIENRIDGKVDALDATVSSETTSKHVKVVIVQENGVLSGVTLTDSDIASASALTAEIAARKAVDGQTGQTYKANTSSSYINNAVDLNDADVKLAAALKSLSDATVNEVQVNGKTLTETNNAVNVQISAAAGTGAASTPITVDTSEKGAITLKLEGLDCGTY